MRCCLRSNGAVSYTHLDVYKRQGLLSGTATPAFNGTPTRTGYIFGGWDPEVAETVTGNAIYTATWKVDANGNGIADDLEDKFTEMCIRDSILR